jgi:hypothetical protein
MITEPRTQSESQLGSRLRVALIVVLLAVSVVWPLVNVGPRGPTVLAITYNHGVDLGDFLAIIPFSLALVLVYARRR